MGEDEPDAVQSEAILIARRIKELVEPQSGTPPLRVYDRRLEVTGMHSTGILWCF